MKIGYLMQSGVPDIRAHPPDGAANHVIQIITNLRLLGHQVGVLFLQNRQILFSDDLYNYETIPIPRMDKGVVKYVESGIRRYQCQLRIPYFAFFEALRFRSACKQVFHGYDLLYERMGWMGYGGWLAAKSLGIPIIYEVNGDHLSELEALGIPPSRSQKLVWQNLTRKSVHQAAHIVASGDGWRKKFINRWDYSHEKVTTVENGSELVNRLDRMQLKSFRQPDPTAQHVNIIYLGAFEPWHGITILLDAFKQASQLIDTLHLHLVGLGTLQKKIEMQIQDLNLHEYVTLTGQLSVNQFSAYMLEADIGVSPYCGRDEFSGLKLIDYKAAGLAIIASGKDGQPDIIDHEQTGIVVPPCDRQALCNAIIRLAKDVHLRQKLGQMARIEAENHHSWSSTAQELDNIFNPVVSR